MSQGTDPHSPYEPKHEDAPTERDGASSRAFRWLTSRAWFQAISKRLSGVKAFLHRYEKVLWWMHSLYALGLGITVIIFAQKGFERARLLALSIGGAWLLAIFFFRIFGSGLQQMSHDRFGPKTRIQFFAMTYVMKNLYQGMLFFLLPFYWKSTSFDSPNRYLVFVLGICALLSTLDLVFDRLLLKWKTAAAAFHSITLFSCLNLLIPALFPNTRTVLSLMLAGGATVIAAWTFHVRWKSLREPRLLIFMSATIAIGMTAAYFLRKFIPPVPMHLAQAAVGPMVLPDGRLAMEVTKLHHSVIPQLLAVTDVNIPGGKGDRLHHVWRHNGSEVARYTEHTSHVAGPKGAVRLRSSLLKDSLPSNLVGEWSVDIETEDEQLVGRVRFTVLE